MRIGSVRIEDRLSLSLRGEVGAIEILDLDRGPALVRLARRVRATDNNGVLTRRGTERDGQRDAERASRV